MATAKHQAAWRAHAKRTRVEVYLTDDELARLDSIGCTRAEALRRFLAGAVIPADALDRLRRDFSDQDAAYGVDWPEATKAAAMMAERRRSDVQRSRERRASEHFVDRTKNERNQRRQTGNGLSDAERQRQSREQFAVKNGIPEVVEALRKKLIGATAAKRIAQMPVEQQADELVLAIARAKTRAPGNNPDPV